MASFTIHGVLAGRERSATWTDGRLDGDPVLLMEADAAVTAQADVLLPGVWSGRATLNHQAGALATLTEVFTLEGVIPRVEGDELVLEPAPAHGVN